jgi:two-component system phosphate regulon sensor histidine kinase PhoR
VATALASRRTGEAVRHSSTLDQDTLYAAVYVPAHDVVLRVSVPLRDLAATMRVYDTSLWGGIILIAAASVLWSVWSARAIVFPLGRLLVLTKDPAAASREISDVSLLTDDARWAHKNSDEWSELETNIANIRRDLLAKAQSLTMEQVQLDTILAAISDAILAVDTQGRPLFFNSRFEILCGTESPRREGVKLWEIFRDPHILEPFRDALRDGKIGEARTLIVEMPDGRKRYFSLSVSPLRTAAGPVYGAVGIFHDVTELKSAEQMRIEFVANATHELRTPLTSIKGYGETLELDLQDGRAPDLDFVRAINRNAERLMNLMNDLLDLSTLESTDILQKEQLSTDEITKKVLHQLQGGFTRKNQRIDSQFGTPRVFADPNRIEQVLVNLLDNANKYAPPAGEIKVEWRAEGKDTLLKVRNDGPGIPVEHHARLFERFYRVDKARSRDQGGTGLGLAIVKHIMQRHGGAIWVESRPGEGVVFTCRFPDARA